MSIAIHIKDAVKKFGKDTIIDGLNLEVKPGEFFTLLGPSGCGKTTLLRMIIGFNSIEGGEIRLDDRVINNVPVNQRNIGMVFQNYAIFPNMSVRDNVAFGLKTRKVPKEEMDARIDEILQTVKIEQLKDRMPAKLSGGQQQRVALARALVIEPGVLLMDEPLSNLDAKLRVEMRNVIKQIQQEVGITTVYVTHDQEEALAVSDRIAVMNHGVVQQVGTPREIYRRPANTFVATFIGLSNLLKGKARKSDSGCIITMAEGYSFSSEAQLGKDEETVTLSVRPEEFVINTDGTAGIPATIRSNVFLGTSSHYFATLDTGEDVEIIQDDSDIDEILPGTPITLTILHDRINVFDESGDRNLIAR